MNRDDEGLATQLRKHQRLDRGESNLQHVHQVGMNSLSTEKERARIAAGIFALFLTSVVTAGAAIGPPPAVNPATNRSPSGEFVCEIDPTDVYGGGEAHYRLLHKGAVVWEGMKPFTLFETGVTDDGVVAGYGYTRGPESDTQWLGEFVVAILAPTGEVRMKEGVRCEMGRYPDSPPSLVASGIVLDQVNGRFIVRICDPDINRGSESWWTYELATGKAIGSFALAAGDGGRASPISAVPVAGTPLLLLHYLRYDRPNHNARFALIDPSLKEVWSLTWPRDYNVDGNKKAQDLLLERIRADGAILKASVSNQFDLFSAKKSERVTFRVQSSAQDTNAWVVSEIARAKFQPPKARPEERPAVLKKPLKLLGTFSLHDDMPAAKSPVHDVNWFGFDDHAGIGLLRFAGGADYSFALIEEDGSLIHEKPLLKQTGPLLSADLKCAWVGGNRWVVIASGLGAELKSAAWWLDAVSGSLEPIPGFVCPVIRGLVGTGDGGFVTIVSNQSDFTREDGLIAFDAAGNSRWRINEDSQNKNAPLRPGGIALTSRRQIAMLDGFQCKVLLFGLGGSRTGTLDLEKAWGRKPSFPEEISADGRGSLLILDSHSTPPVVRMAADGRIVSQFELKHPDGRAINPTRGAKLSPMGRVWACDDDSLVRVNQAGIADLVLGPATQTARLEQVAAVAVDQRGHICAVDARTGDVHLFDTNGKQLRVCSPNSTDFSGTLLGAHVTLTENGEVWLGESDGPRAPAKYLRFGPDGRRIAVQQLGLDVNEQWYSLPDGERFLVLGYHDAFIVRSEGKVLRKIQRRPDNSWLEYPASASVAPDGSFAIVSGGYAPGPGFFISLYSSQGDPIRTVFQPDGSINFGCAFTGKYVVTCTESEIRLSNALGKPVLAFQGPLEHFRDGGWACFGALGGRELWMVSPGLKKVVRFELAD